VTKTYFRIYTISPAFLVEERGNNVLPKKCKKKYSQIVFFVTKQHGHEIPSDIQRLTCKAFFLGRFLGKRLDQN
jgi:hypothetical protein